MRVADGTTPPDQATCGRALHHPVVKVEPIDVNDRAHSAASTGHSLHVPRAGIQRVVSLLGGIGGRPRSCCRSIPKRYCDQGRRGHRVSGCPCRRRNRSSHAAWSSAGGAQWVAVLQSALGRCFRHTTMSSKIGVRGHHLQATAMPNPRRRHIGVRAGHSSRAMDRTKIRLSLADAAQEVAPCQPCRVFSKHRRLRSARICSRHRHR